MGKLKLREPAPAAENETGGVTLKPMRISGVVVAKADLIAALRLYLNLSGIDVSEDGETFILRIEGGEPGEDRTAR